MTIHWPPFGEASFIFFRMSLSLNYKRDAHCMSIRLGTAALVSVGSLLLVSLAWAAEPPPAPAAGTPSNAAAPAEQRFDVLEYRVVGNTVLPNRDIERVLYPLLGPGKTLADVEVARTALEKLYHDKGFGTVFVDIPPQTVNDGLVRLRATEGRVESTQISGARYFAERDVIARLPATTPGTVLQISKLQEQLNAVNSETPDRSVVPVLKAGSEPGTVDLSLKVQDTLPLHGSLELNNQATVDTRSLRSIANLSYDDLFGELDSISLQYQASPQQLDQVRVIALNYVEHAFQSGLQPSLSYINSNSNVPTAGTLGVLGIGEIWSAKLAYPVATSSASVQSVNIGIDYKHFRNTINQNATTALNTPISYINLSAGYTGFWRSDWQTTTFTASANAGPRGLANNPDAFAGDRYKGNANYFYFRADLATVFKLPADFSLKLRAAGQGATEALITNEDYSISGADGVRGYIEAEELADKAVKGTVQLNSPHAHWNDRVLGDAFSFFDIGKATVIDPLPGEPTGATLRSWGFGLDLLPDQKVTGGMTWAKMLDAASVTRAGSSRVLFFLRGSF
jgi:hemolysin activation/secretion protein